MDKRKCLGIYYGIKSRCYNPKCTAYPNYGAKGIGMCQEWEEDPESFLLWMEYSGWTPGSEIHREKAAGDYGPENCVVMSKDTHKTMTRSNASAFVGELHKIGMSAQELALRWGVTPRQISNVGKNPSQKDWDALEGIKKEINAKKK